MKNVIAQKIYELRKARGWSQVQLANEIGISRLMIVKFEKGQMPSSGTTAKLEAKFGLPENFLEDLKKTIVEKEPEIIQEMNTKGYDGKLLRKKFSKVLKCSPEDKHYIESVFDQMLAKYDLSERVEVINGLSGRKPRKFAH